MNKLIWILVVGVIVIAGAYFVYTKNNITPVQTTSTNNDQRNIEPTVSQQQSTQVKTPTQTTTKPTKPAINNSGGIPQPPKLPE